MFKTYYHASLLVCIFISEKSQGSICRKTTILSLLECNSRQFHRPIVMLTISYSRIFLLFLLSLPYSPLSNNIKKNKRYCRPPATTNIVLKSCLKPQSVFTLVVFLFSLLYSCFSFVMYKVFFFLYSFFFSISFDDCFTK